MAPALVLLLLAPAVVAFLALYAFPRRRAANGKPYNLPPGSTCSLPFLGETLAYLRPRDGTTLGKFLEHQIARYGRIFRLNLFGETMILSADAELNRLVLQGEGRTFRSSYPKSVEEVFREWATLALEGSMHKKMRNIAMAFWTGPRLRELIVGDLERHALQVLRSLSGDVPFSAKELVRRFTFNFVVDHCLSMQDGDANAENLKAEFATFINVFTSFPIKLPGTAYWRGLKSRANILKMIDEEMKERIQTQKIKTSEMETQDMLGYAMNTDLTSEQILDLILLMLFGGHETVTTAITLAIYFLGRSSKALEELRLDGSEIPPNWWSPGISIPSNGQENEHLEVAQKKKLRGESALTWEDYKQMDFTHCVINETLRLGNVSRFAQRKALRDVHYNGYDIPSGCTVMALFEGVHLDSSIYSDPQEFNPWRWEGQSCSSIYFDKNFMPFGGGSRLCIGWELAKLEMVIFLHHFVLGYTWEFVEIDVPMAYPYTDFAKGLPIIVHPYIPI